MSESIDLDAQWFHAFLEGDPAAQTDYTRRYEPRLIAAAKRLVADWSRLELAEDVVQEMWLLVFSRSQTAYDPSRGSVMTYLYQVLHDAARNVRTAHTPPGQPTRPKKDREGKTHYPALALSLDAPAISTLAGEGVSLHSAVADDRASAAQEAALARLDLVPAIHWFRRSSPEVVKVLSSMYHGDLSLRAAADQLHISRDAVNRSIKRFRAVMAA